MKKKVIDFLKNQGILILALGLVVFIFGRCPIRWILGIPCPSCGITRACEAALHLDFVLAFHYHPLFWIIPFALAYMIFGKKPLLGSKKRESKFYMVIIIILISVYIYRMLTMFPNVEPMTYNRNSIIEKVFEIYMLR